MSLKIFFWLMLMALLWGPSFLFVKVAVAEIPPLTLAAVRVVLASLILYGVLRLQGRSLPKFGPIWKHFALMGLFSNALPFALLNWGEQYTDSALAAMLVGLTPIFTMILAHFFIADDHLTPTKIFGALLGFGGLVALLGPSLVGGVQATTLGLIACALSPISYGIALIYGQKHLRGLPPLVGPTTQLMMASIYLLPISLIVEQPFSGLTPSGAALGSLLALVVVCTVLAYVVYYHAMELMTASTLSLMIYMIPIVATILGVTVLGERLGWNAYVGFAFILLGIMAVNGVFHHIRRQRRWGAMVGSPGK